jgi:choline transport protein
MVWSFYFNALIAFGFMILLLFFMGDPEAVLGTTTGWPIIQICYQAAHGNLSGANTLMCMIIIPGITSYFNGMAAVSRLTWAFG